MQKDKIRQISARLNVLSQQDTLTLAERCAQLRINPQGLLHSDMVAAILITEFTPIAMKEYFTVPEAVREASL